MEKNSFLEKSALLLGGTTYNINVTIFAVSIGVIAAAFKDASSMQISLLISLPAIFMMPGVFFSGIMCQFVGKKWLLVAGLVLFGISGLASGFMTSITGVLVCRVVTGFSIGFCAPIPRAIIPQIYPDIIGKLNGFQVVVSNGISFVLSIICGVLATMSWKYPIYIFSIAFVIAIFIIAFLPNIPSEKREKIKTDEPKIPLGKNIWIVFIFTWIVFMTMSVVQIKMSIMIQQEHIGTSALAGIASSIMTIGAVIGGYVFAYMYKKNIKITLLLALAAPAIGYFLLGYVSNVIPLLGACFFIGFGSIGMIVPWCITTVSKLAPKPRITFAVSFLTGVMYFGQFCTAYFIAIVEKIFNNTSPRISLLVVGTIFIILISIVTIISVTQVFTNKMKIEKSEERLS